MPELPQIREQLYQDQLSPPKMRNPTPHSDALPSKSASSGDRPFPGSAHPAGNVPRRRRNPLAQAPAARRRRSLPRPGRVRRVGRHGNRRVRWRAGGPRIQQPNRCSTRTRNRPKRTARLGGGRGAAAIAAGRVVQVPPDPRGRPAVVAAGLAFVASYSAYQTGHWAANWFSGTASE